jgi:hypothetical protein
LQCESAINCSPSEQSFLTFLIWLKLRRRFVVEPVNGTLQKDECCLLSLPLLHVQIPLLWEKEQAWGNVDLNQEWAKAEEKNNAMFVNTRKSEHATNMVCAFNEFCACLCVYHCVAQRNTSHCTQTITPLSQRNTSSPPLL